MSDIFVIEDVISQSTAWRTDPGLVRRQNEDFVAVYEPAAEPDLHVHGRLYIVADGVGGADAGEIASRYASERMLHHYLKTPGVDDWGERLLEAMQSANTDLRKMASGRDDNRPMATTMVAAVIVHNLAYIGNVGDSRAYHWHSGGLTQITRDQSLVAQLVEEGALTLEEAAKYPYKNIILYSIGSENRPPIDRYEVELEEGDFLLLCSDGLTRHLSDDEIGEIIGREAPETAAETMVRMARERGGEDNITLIIVPHNPAAAQPGPALAGMVAAEAIPTAPPHHRSLWSITLFLMLVMVVLIFMLWVVIQRVTVV